CRRAREATLMETLGPSVFARACCATENVRRARTPATRRPSRPAAGHSPGAEAGQRLRCINLEHRVALSPRRADDPHWQPFAERVAWRAIVPWAKMED